MVLQRGKYPFANIGDPHPNTRSIITAPPGLKQAE